MSPRARPPALRRGRPFHGSVWPHPAPHASRPGAPAYADAGRRPSPVRSIRRSSPEYTERRDLDTVKATGTAPRTGRIHVGTAQACTGTSNGRARGADRGRRSVVIARRPRATSSAARAGVVVIGLWSWRSRIKFRRPSTSRSSVMSMRLDAQSPDAAPDRIAGDTASRSPRSPRRDPDGSSSTTPPIVALRETGARAVDERRDRASRQQQARAWTRWGE